ncbi:MAG: RagB/SusD family nutrient uptake outer membrane protein [Bacteroidales bacterium]|nr:RagB/SusD family nutrient uptake outer membrane protein [Bacteroidales bacterium]
MKKLYIKCSAIFILLLSTLSSCDFLDIDPYTADLFTLDTIFAKKEYAQRYLSNVYSYLSDHGNFSCWGYNAGPWVLLTDEGISGYKRNNHNYNYFCNNEMTSEDMQLFDHWDSYYRGIRKANTFINRINECKEVSELQKSEWIGEANFVKANLYFELMLMYGPVPIMPDSPIDFDTPIADMMVERNTWDECSDYVSKLLETAIKNLPVTVRDNSEVGKPTKQSAMAVLSRLTLYTASPLFNGQNNEFSNFKNNKGTPYLNPEKSIEKWAIAAANAKRLVIEKPNDLYTVPKMDNTPIFPVPAAEQAAFPNGVGGIDPYHSYADMFNGECVLASSNKEILFSRQSSEVNPCIKYQAPMVIGGWSVFFIPQSLVDAYSMIDGKSINNASNEYPYEDGFTDNDSVFSGSKSNNGFTILSNTHKMYVNREMRFYATVAYNNSYFPSTSTPPDKVDQQDGKVAKYFSDSKSGRDYALTVSGGEAEQYPMTGYLCRKFIHYEDSWLNGGRLKTKYNIVYRMAEIYLNYVEAMNELDKSYTINDVTVSRDVSEMKRCFNLIRHRAGLPGITDADVASVEKMRDLILHERRIEFAWEGLRYHDLRRTKKAVIYENAPINGLNVGETEDNPDKFYIITRVKERDWIYKVFTNRQTFFPISKTEIDKNYNLDQFPGF